MEQQEYSEAITVLESLDEPKARAAEALALLKRNRAGEAI